MNEVYESKDKQICPYLLAHPGIHFHGTQIIGESIYFQFSPKNKAQELVNLFITHKALPIEPKNLLEAVETYRDIVFEMKEKRRNYALPNP